MVVERDKSNQKDWKNSVECAIIKKEKRKKKVVGLVQPREE